MASQPAYISHLTNHQYESEIAALSAILMREGVTSYLEIGSKYGASLWYIASWMPSKSRIVAVDLPKGTREWRTSGPSLVNCVAELKRRDFDATVLFGDSRSDKIIEQVKALGPFDAVLIDANHTKAFLDHDWHIYGSMGRIVAFHDIAWRRAPEWEGVRIDVPEFWNEIKGNYRHEEIKHDPSQKNNGIGVLWRS